MTDTLSKTILEVADVKQITPDFAEIKIINKETAEKIQAVVYDKEKNTLKILTTNNFPEQLKKLLAMLDDKGFSTDVYYTSTEAFQHALSWYDQLSQQEQQQAAQQKKQRQAAGKYAVEMIKKLFDKRGDYEPGDFVMEIVRLAFQTGASDLHFQAEDKGVITRVRIDGVLQEVVVFTHDDFKKYLQKLKFIAGTKMNVDYVPQDGRFSFDAEADGEKKKIDARINFMPGFKSESTVIRYLDGSDSVKSFEQIGFVGQTYDVLKKNIEKNTGIIIVSGPTGSGKTTTLYSILNYLNQGTEKIITLEDPVEYQVSGIQQSQIDSSKGYTYELGLKAILRHDPDVILVGETRTLETAEISVNAALTGHLVFTTLHTNSAIEAISRMINMGVKGYTLGPSLNMICGQRLVRRIDPDSMKKREATYAEAEEIKAAIKKINDANPKMNLEFDGTVPEAVPTESNNSTGYKGRIAIVETFDVTDEIKQMILDGKSMIDMYGKARENGYLTLYEDGILKMLKGETTLDELRRVI